MKVRRLPHTTYQQRNKTYQDIVNLIEPGFLSIQVRVGKAYLSLRSLNSSDFFLLSHRLTPTTIPRIWKAWWLATSTWMIDGICLLDEKHAVHKIFHSLQSLPTPYLEELFRQAKGLNNRYNNAIEGVEAYCYEDLSRMTWKQMGETLDNDRFGIPGVRNLGYNTVQRMWIAFNQYEDQRLDEQVRWSHAKMLASAQAPKGIESINKRDEDAFEKEVTRRQMVRDLWFYQVVGVLSKTEKDQISDKFQVNTRIKTVESLETEMKNWLSGEMDEHDNVIEEYKKSIVERMQFDRHSRRESWQEARETQVEEEYLPASPEELNQGLSLDQIQNYHKGRYGGAQRTHRTVEVYTEKQYDILNNHILPKEFSPNLLVDQQGRLIPKGGLQEQVKDRRLILTEDGEIKNG